MGNGSGVSWQSVAGAMGGVITILLTAAVTMYAASDDRHETRQGQRIEQNERELRAVRDKQREIHHRVGNNAKGLQWLIDQRVAEVGAGNITTPPPRVHE